MNGQWTGPYAGTNSGMLVINLDNAGDQYAGEIVASTTIQHFQQSRACSTFQKQQAHIPLGSRWNRWIGT
jgi:hypothetical protein